jgi:hypothetical protein
MSYDSTKVPISQSQEAIRRLIYAHHGTGVSLISQPPREGFEALVSIGDLPYRIRVMATCAKTDPITPQGKKRPPSVIADLQQAEIRRVWRVLYWHLKAMFEAADSGVIDIRDVIMPYVVTRDGKTISEHIVPQMERAMIDDPARMLVDESDAPRKSR